MVSMEGNTSNQGHWSHRSQATYHHSERSQVLLRTGEGICRALRGVKKARKICKVDMGWALPGRTFNGKSL
jgi:hypothetical protein